LGGVLESEAMRKTSNYVRFNEFTDAISSVQLVADLVGPVQRRPLLWKWIVIGAHNGLQGAMVCALSGTDGTGALKPASRKAMLEFLSGPMEHSIPDEWLADFPSLLNWVQDKTRMLGGEVWRPSAEKVRKLRQLNELRRNFAHYTPKSWSIESAGLPSIIGVALEGTEHLMLQPSRVMLQLTGNQKRALTHALRKARLGLNKSA
jgi:hypothetical protein